MASLGGEDIPLCSPATAPRCPLGPHASEVDTQWTESFLSTLSVSMSLLTGHTLQNWAGLPERLQSHPWLAQETSREAVGPWAAEGGAGKPLRSLGLTHCSQWWAQQALHLLGTCPQQTPARVPTLAQQWPQWA